MQIMRLLFVNNNVFLVITILFWQLEAAEFAAHNESVNSSKLIHEDSVIVTCSNDKTVAFWVRHALYPLYHAC